MPLMTRIQEAVMAGNDVTARVRRVNGNLMGIGIDGPQSSPVDQNIRRLQKRELGEVGRERRTLGLIPTLLTSGVVGR